MNYFAIPKIDGCARNFHTPRAQARVVAFQIRLNLAPSFPPHAKRYVDGGSEPGELKQMHEHSRVPLFSRLILRRVASCGELWASLVARVSPNFDCLESRLDLRT